jgi:hypothetical protein
MVGHDTRVPDPRTGHQEQGTVAGSRPVPGAARWKMPEMITTGTLAGDRVGRFA